MAVLLLCLAAFASAFDVTVFVWEDENGSGNVETGEVGRNGVQVTLAVPTLQPIGLSTTRVGASNGIAFFDNLPSEASTSFEVAAPSGFVFTRQGGGESDVNSQGQSVQFNTATNPTFEAGIVQLASLSVYAWEDLNANGLQDSGEPPLPNIAFSLAYPAQQPGSIPPPSDPNPVTTGANGIATFTDLWPYTGLVTITATPGNIPSGYFLTTENALLNTKDGLDSDFDPANNEFQVALTSGASVNHVGLGLFQEAQLQVLVWDDNNGDGVRQTTGLEADANSTLSGVNVKISLTGQSDTTLSTAAITGIAEFTNLRPGEYVVTVSKNTNPVEFNYSPIGSSPTLTNSVVDSLAGQVTLDLDSGASVSIASGQYHPITIGPVQIWIDTNGNGIFDAGEPPAVGATAELSNVNTIPIDYSGLTDANGQVTFNNIVPGNYNLRLGLLSQDFVYTLQNINGNPISSVDSDVSPADGIVVIVAQSRMVVGSEVTGNTLSTIGAGMYIPAQIFISVWEDLDHNGLEDNDEPGVPNAQVTVTPESGSEPAVTKLANVDGKLTFTGLRPNTYTVFVDRGTFSITLQDQGGTVFDGVDSDIDPTTGQVSVTLVSGERDTSIGAGLYLPATIQSFVWNDLNGDGIQDVGEPGIVGVGAIITRSITGDSVAGGSAISDANGIITFDPVGQDVFDITYTPPAGSNYLATYQNVGGDDTLDSDVNPSTLVSTVSTTKGQTLDNADAGFYIAASINPFFVFNDLDGDGIRDADEPGIDGVTVELYTPKCLTPENVVSCDPLATTATNNGTAIFSDLRPGSYLIRVLSPGDGFLVSPANQGGNEQFDSDINGFGIATFNVISGSVLTSQAAGYYEVSFIQDFYVWYDINEDGIQQANEPGVFNTEVQVRFEGSNEIVQRGLTNNVGRITFELHVGGSFDIQVIRPDGWSFSPANEDDDLQDLIDSDVDDDGTVTVDLALGSILSGVAAGMYIDDLGTVGIDYSSGNSDSDQYSPIDPVVLPGFLIPSPETIPGVSTDEYFSSGDAAGLSSGGFVLWLSLSLSAALSLIGLFI